MTLRCLSTYCLIIVFLIAVLTPGIFAENGSFLSANLSITPNISNKISPELSSDWKEKLSSDLLQLLDPAACSPGRTSADLARDMEMVGQLQYDSFNQSVVPVTITLTKYGGAGKVISFLNQTAQDPYSGLITGWILVNKIPEVASLPQVQQITVLLPPVLSGNMLTEPETFFVPDSSTIQTPSAQYSIPMSGISNGTDQFGKVISKEPFFSHLHSSGTPRQVENLKWEEKLSTDLLQLLDDQYLSPGQSRQDMQTLMTATGELRETAQNESEVMISAHLSPGALTNASMNYFSKAGSDPLYGKIAGWISLSNLTFLAQEAGIVSIMAQIPPFTSRISTEGDVILHTNDLRNATNLTGQGVKVGIISDGVSSIENIIAAGELPDEVQTIRCTIGGDEGTAMLQIVHDIAPDAELYFHDRGSSQIEFVQAMDALINSGCRIICDDITYVEPFFEDGYIARNIRDRVLSYDILYITSAGNFAQEHYQGTFSGYMDNGYPWHDFQGSNGSRDLKFTAPPHSAGHIILQWDDMFFQSSNNYDLFLYNSEYREIGRSVKIQDGDDDPMENCRFINNGDEPTDFYVRVVQAGGETRTIEVYVLPMGGNPVTVDPNVPEDSMFGQQAVTEAISVGAVGPENNFTTVQKYSSRGPVTIKYPKPELREKPELSAPDGVTISIGSGMMASFSGTSASAPHIAGLASLIWSSDSKLRAGDIKNMLINATSEDSIWNPATGYGVPDARRLIPSVQTIPQENMTFTMQGNYLRTFAPREMEPADTLILYPGWNMVSIPFPLESENNTGWIFSDINTVSHTIWRYTGNDTHWIRVGAEDMFQQMDVIWVYSANKTEVLLEYDDSRRNMTARHLTAGWNPLGIPGRSTLTACDLFSPLKSSWSYILVYDPRLQQYRPAIINGGSGPYSDERLLYPTEGFWIYMNGPGVIIP
jgi:subtilisin family serine protease